MSAKVKNSKPAVKTATKTAPAKNVVPIAKLKKGDSVVFTGWAGGADAPDGAEDITKGMIGRVSLVGKTEATVMFEAGGDSVEIPFELSDNEIRLATKSDIAKAKAARDSEESDVDDDDEGDDTEPEGPTEGELADEGDRAAIKSLTKRCKAAGIDPNDYETWAEAEDALADSEGGEPDDIEDVSSDEGEEEDESLGAKADAEDKSAIRALTKRCKAAGIEPDEYDTWVEIEEALIEAEEAPVVEDTVKGKGKSKVEAAPAKPKREPSVGRLADEGDKAAVREMTKRCKAVGLDPDDYETWVAAERELKAAEKEASRPALKVTKEVQAELGEDNEDAISAAKRLMETAERTYYTLGGVLAVIDRQKLYEGVKVRGEYPYQGMQGFADFCEEQLGVRYRKAKYLIAIYEAFTNAGLTAAKIGTIGWSKAKELVAILQAEPEQADKWIELAKAKGIPDVVEAVKTHMTKIGAKVHGNSKGASARSVTVKFTLHEDEGAVIEEALTKARELADVESDSEAFAYIVKEWLSFQG